jgi:CBS domain containing-hemolysin-like protein
MEEIDSKELSKDPEQSLIGVVSAWAERLKQQLRSCFRLNRNVPTLKEEVAELIEEHDFELNKIGNEEKTILSNVLHFGGTKVSDIMIHRTDIVAVEQNISLEDLKKVLLEHEHTRMPVYLKTLDNVIGFVHIKDLIPILINEKPYVMDNIIRQLLVVSPSMKNIDLLAKMRQSRVHMALVLDEYGGTDGLVTIENLIETIVGDIKDEHDDTLEPDIILLDEETVEASARLSIEKLEKQLGVQISEHEDDDFDTLGGLLSSLVGYVPSIGEKILHPNQPLEFEIIDSDPRRVKRILIRKKQKLDNVGS